MQQSYFYYFFITYLGIIYPNVLSFIVIFQYREDIEILIKQKNETEKEKVETLEKEVEGWKTQLSI